jgi:hypothetical protein
MKTKILISGLILAFACSIPPGVTEQEGNEGQSKLDRPQTVFEGVWLWLKTEGEGIAGPYERDSVSEGHSIRYDFVDMNKMQVYFNADKQVVYDYTYTMSDGMDKPGVLILENKQAGSPMPERYYWEIEVVGDDTYLYLSNTEPCCDNVFTQYFKLMKRHEP